jgi:hypothetical protein
VRTPLSQSDHAVASEVRKLTSSSSLLPLTVATLFRRLSDTTITLETTSLTIQPRSATCISKSELSAAAILRETMSVRL